MQVLDFVITPNGSFAIITECIDNEASIEFIGENKFNEGLAWYNKDELIIIDSLPLILARMGTSSGGSNSKIPKNYFNGNIKIREED